MPLILSLSFSTIRQTLTKHAQRRLAKVQGGPKMAPFFVRVNFIKY